MPSALDSRAAQVHLGTLVVLAHPPPGFLALGLGSSSLAAYPPLTAFPQKFSPPPQTLQGSPWCVSQREAQCLECVEETLVSERVEETRVEERLVSERVSGRRKGRSRRL